MERDALGALRPDAGQPAELVDQILDRAFVHATYRPGRPRPPSRMPPVTGPIFSVGQLADRAVGVADRGDDEVLQRLDVVGVDGLGVDGERGELAGAGERGRDQAAARRCR